MFRLLTIFVGIVTFVLAIQAYDSLWHDGAQTKPNVETKLIYGD